MVSFATSIDLLEVKRLQAAQLPTFKPTSEQEKYIRDGLAFLVVRAPFFAHLFYNECRLLYTEAVPWAATDGRNIFVNPDAMKAEGWNIRNVAFVLAHEIGHCIFNHLLAAVRFRRDNYVLTPNLGKLPYLQELMNVAEDFVINAMLIEAKIGEPPKIILFDKSVSEKGMEAAVAVYEKIFTPQGAGGFKAKRFDVHLEPGLGQVADQGSGRHEQAIAAAVEAAQAAGQGVLPGAIKRLFGEIVDPKVPWQDHLRSTAMRHSGDPVYDWRYLDKRLQARAEPMYFARQSHTGAGLVVLAGDTSGSINDHTLDVFMSEMHGIAADLNPAQLIIIWCDAHVHRVDELEDVDDLTQYKEMVDSEGGPGGGGGTSFRPVFQWIEEHGVEPDMLIYLTDCMGSFPHDEPSYPVVWACTMPDPNVPFGEVIHVEI